MYKAAVWSVFPEDSHSDELPMSSFDFGQNQGMMSAHHVNGGLVLLFVEMVKRKAVLFLEMENKRLLGKAQDFWISACSLKNDVLFPFGSSNGVSDLPSKKNCIVSG